MSHMKVPKEQYNPSQATRDYLEALWLADKLSLPGAFYENIKKKELSYMCKHGRFYDDDYCLICYHFVPNQHDHGHDGQGR